MGLFHDSEVAFYEGHRIEVAARVDNVLTARSQYSLLIDATLVDNVVLGFWAQVMALLGGGRYEQCGTLTVEPYRPRRAEAAAADDRVQLAEDGVSRTVRRDRGRITPNVGPVDEPLPVVVTFYQSFLGTRYELEVAGEPCPLRRVR